MAETLEQTRSDVNRFPRRRRRTHGATRPRRWTRRRRVRASVPEHKL